MNLNLIQFAAHIHTQHTHINKKIVAINQPRTVARVSSIAIHFSDHFNRCGFDTYFPSKKMLRFVVLAFFGIYLKKTESNWIELNWPPKAAETILYAVRKWLLTILAILITFNKFCIADDAAAIALSSMPLLLPLLLPWHCSNKQASATAVIAGGVVVWRCCNVSLLMMENWIF